MPGEENVDQRGHPGSGSASQGSRAGSNDRQTTPEVENKPKRQGKGKIHSRTASYNKINALTRPGISRSKSTDGVIRVKRNNKSFTKLANLQPLTKTLSNQSLKSNKSNTSLKNLAIYGHPGGLTLTHKQGKAILKLNDEDDDYEDLEDIADEEQAAPQDPVYDGSNANIANGPGNTQGVNMGNIGGPIGRDGSQQGFQDVPLQQVFQQALENYNYAEPAVLPNQQLAQTSTHEQRHQASEPAKPPRGVRHQVSDTQLENLKRKSLITESTPEAEEEESEHESATEPERGREEQKKEPNIPRSIAALPTDDGVEATKPQQVVSNVPNEKQAYPHAVQTMNHQNGSETELNSTGATPSSNLYGASLFLSQSTGLVKKIDPHEMNAYEPLGESNTDSGSISFKANRINLDQSVAKPVIVNKNVIKENSYQPNQTIFNNLQRTNSQYVNTKRQLQQQQQQSQNPQHAETQQQYTQQGNDSDATRNVQINLNGANNFSNFLDNTKSSLSDSHDNRTQQRLWLQRENSLMDVTLDAHQLANLSNLSLNNLMFSHNYPSSANLSQMGNNASAPGTPAIPNGHGNGSSAQLSQMGYIGSQIGPLTPMTSEHPNMTSNSNGVLERTGSTTNMNGLLTQFQNGTQNPIQSRIEFERLNREYLNVRRHLNPIGESLNRFKANTIEISKREGGASESNKNGNTFKEFSPSFQDKEQEVSAALNKIWQDALLQTSSIKARQGNMQNTQQHPFSSQSYTNSPQQMQRPQMQRLQSRSQYMNLRSAQAPTTRAVKLQAQAQAQAQAQSLRQPQT